METYALRLKKEVVFRDYINQFPANIEQDNDEEWWTDPHATETLSRLTGSAQWAVSDFLELRMGNGGNLVVAVWNGGTDTQGLEQLANGIQDRLEKVVEAQKPCYEQARDKAKSESMLFLKKLEINFLFSPEMLRVGSHWR